MGERWHAKRKFKITWFSPLHFFLKFPKIESKVFSWAYRFQFMEKTLTRKTDTWLVCKSVEQLFSDRIWTWKCINSYQLIQWCGWWRITWEFLCAHLSAQSVWRVAKLNNRCSNGSGVESRRCCQGYKGNVNVTAHTQYVNIHAPTPQHLWQQLLHNYTHY